jgi:hypothetical protein
MMGRLLLLPRARIIPRGKEIKILIKATKILRSKPLN